MVLGSKKEISRCGLGPAHAMCYDKKHECVCYHTSAAQLASTSSSVSKSPTNSLRDYELHEEHEQELQTYHLPQVSCIWPNCPLSLEARPCQITGTFYLEKHTNLLGFRITTLAEKVHRKTALWALQERWTKETVSVAAIFSRRCSRVGKIQAFEDGLTDDFPKPKYFKRWISKNDNSSHYRTLNNTVLWSLVL